MALRASAFGPLSRGSAQAASLLSGGAAAFPGISLGRLSGRSFGEPQGAAQSITEPVGLASGAAAPVEEQQPLLPQGEATGERGDITQLPGFQAATAPGGAAELPSSAELSQSEQQTASELRNQLNRLAGEGGGAQTMIDAAKGLKAASTTLKVADTLKRLLGSNGGPSASVITGVSKPALSGLGGLSGIFDSLGGTSVSDIFAASRVPYTVPVDLSGATKPGLLTGAAEPAAGTGAGTSGATSATGTAAGVSGAVSAVLGLIAALTGNQELQTAATGLGLGTTALGVANALSGAAAGAGAGGAAGGAAAAAPAATGVAAPAAVLAAPIVGTLLLDSLFSKKGDDIISSTIQDYQGAYPTFPQELMRSERQQGIGLNALTQALPLVQSKGELGQLLNSMKNYVGTTTGIPLDQTDPYRLVTIPGTGPVTHGQQTPSIDWGPQTQALQGVIDLLAERLPGDRLTALYGQPGGGLEGEPAMRLFTQFLDRAQTAPAYLPTTWTSPFNPAGGGEVTLPPGFYGQSQGIIGGGQYGYAPTIEYGQPGYDYAGAGYPEPGQYFGTPSETWQALLGGATEPVASASPAPTGGDLQLALQRLIAQQGGQAGALAPSVPSEFSAALRNPAALQSLLAQPGMLARLFGPTGGA